jgi:hypothetical protein
MRAVTKRDGDEGSASSRRAFRAVVLATGVVATVAGLDTARRGVRSFPGVDDPGSPAVESESRFYGGIYLALGLTTLAMSPRADRDAAGMRRLATTFLVAGVARANAWRDAGRPHPAQQALLALELVLPAVLITWQARLRRR